MTASTHAHSFVDDAIEWRRSNAEEILLRLIRSRCGGIEHDVAAAYATLARRSGALLEAIDRGRLALPPRERDALLLFAQRARRVRALPPETEEASVRETIAEVFNLGSLARTNDDQQPWEGNDAELDLAEALEPEAPAEMPGWRHHFSASALNLFAECPRRWFYRYACAAVEDPGSSASAYGSALHLALEDFHGEYPRPVRRDETSMRRRIRECVTWAFQLNREGFETLVEFELQVRRAQRTAQRYIDWLLAQEEKAPFEVIGREVAAELDLEGHAFVGFIDRLDRDERSGGIAVVDYKTGSIATSAAEYCEKVRKFRDFQLPFYYWARTAEGDRVTKLMLLPLRDALLDVRPIVLEVSAQTQGGRRDNDACGTIGVDELERSRARMIELSELLASGEIRDFSPTLDAGTCAFCCYATACTRRPPAEARRFGS